MILSLAGCYTLLVPLLFLACAPRTVTPSAATVRRGQGIFHVVKPGENLFRIGKAYDTTSDELARANGIRDPRQITVGQKIFIPGATRQVPVEIVTPADGVAPPRSVPHADGEAGAFLSPVSVAQFLFLVRRLEFSDASTSLRLKDAIAPSSMARYYRSAARLGNMSHPPSGGLFGHGTIVIWCAPANRWRAEISRRAVAHRRVPTPSSFEIRKNNLAQDPIFITSFVLCSGRICVAEREIARDRVCQVRNDGRVVAPAALNERGGAMTPFNFAATLRYIDDHRFVTPFTAGTIGCPLLRSDYRR